MSLRRESLTIAEKQAKAEDFPSGKRASLSEHARGRQFSLDADDVAIVQGDQQALHRNLKGRHMQMIAMQVSAVRIAQVNGR